MSEDAELPQPWKPPQPIPPTSFCIDSLPQTSRSSALFKLSDINHPLEAHPDDLRKKKAADSTPVYQRLLSDAQTRRLLHHVKAPSFTPQQPRMSRTETAALLSRLESDARRRKEERERVQEEEEEKKMQEALRLANMHHYRHPDRRVQSRTVPGQNLSEHTFQPVFTRYAARVSQQHGQSSVQRMLEEAERAVLSLVPHDSGGLEEIDDLLHTLQAPTGAHEPRAQARSVRSSGSERRKQAECITHPPKLAPRVALQRARTQFGHLITNDTG